jgi:hypothetical protein
MFEKLLKSCVIDPEFLRVYPSGFFEKLAELGIIFITQFIAYGFDRRIGIEQ